MRVDVVVIGGGPAGLGTAIEARLAGLSVALLERREAPVDKACGEGLMPSARAALARLGVRPAGMEFHGIHYLAPGPGSGASAVARFRSGPGLGVRRTELSAALRARAADVGVRLVHATAPCPRIVPDGVRVGDVEARWAVAADGLHSPVRRALGLDLPARGGTAARYGLRRHVATAPWSDLVEVHWAADAEAYVTPVAPDVVGIAVLGPAGGSFDDGLARFPGLARKVAGAGAVSAVRGAGPLRQRARARVHGPVLLVGDAAGYVDALTGEGIAVGLACGRELVRCLVADRPQDYERAWRRTTRTYRWLTGGLLAATRRPVLRRALVPAARRVPPVFTAVVDRLGG